MSKYTEDFAAMGKVELRAACKAAGITYGKLDNAGMRAALEAFAVKKDADQGIARTSNGPRPVAAAAVKTAPVETPVVSSGPREVITGTVVKPKSLKIEKVRDSSNGVTRPSAGSICRAIWDALDSQRKSLKTIPTFENLRELMKANSWSKNTAMTQYQRWKQFNGVMPHSIDMDEAEAEAGDEADTE